MTIAALRILALVADYRERFGEGATDELAARLFAQIEALRFRPPSACGVCGVAITQTGKGRPRKYCTGCVVGLKHQPLFPRSVGKVAEKSTEGAEE